MECIKTTHKHPMHLYKGILISCNTQTVTSPLFSGVVETKHVGSSNAENQDIGVYVIKPVESDKEWEVIRYPRQVHGVAATGFQTVRYTPHMSLALYALLPFVCQELRFPLFIHILFIYNLKVIV